MGFCTPNFETAFSESRPMKNETRNGSFAETLLFPKNLVLDYYSTNTYATYCGGDFRLQIITNRLRPEGEKILVIRDSYACVAVPFLALQAEEIHVCDIREYEGFVGNRIDLEAYIRENSPDYVLVLYSGTARTDTDEKKYDFFCGRELNQ